MAQKKKPAEKTTVRRIKAADDTPIKSDKPKATKKVVSKVATKNKTEKNTKPTNRSSKKKKNIFSSIIGYFRGAWEELKQVRWPTRSETWSMTGAVLLFTLLFAIVILSLDVGFNWVFEKILK